MFSSRELAENPCPVKHDELPVCTSKIRNDLLVTGEREKNKPVYFFFWITRKLIRLKRGMMKTIIMR